MSYKISALNAATAATTDDLLVLVDAPGGSAETKKITVANFANNLPASTFANAQAFAGGVTLTEPLTAQEESAVAATPAASYRKLAPRDSGGWEDLDDAGYAHMLAWAAGNVAQLPDEPTPAMWQHKIAATGSNYGVMRIECGRDTLAAGTCAVTFQTAFKTILEIFLQDKTAANAMYPSSPATSGFTANGTSTDTFAWWAVGAD